MAEHDDSDAIPELEDERQEIAHDEGMDDEEWEDDQDEAEDEDSVDEV